MTEKHNDDIQGLFAGLDAAERDAMALVEGLSEAEGTRRPSGDAWSVAQCLEHIAVTNAAYMRAMQPSAEAALQRGASGTASARPGVVGRWIVRMGEPPVRPRFKIKTPKIIQPGESVSVTAALQKFQASQKELRGFIERYAGINLVGVTFGNPFIKGAKFSLATGMYLLVAHERRHLWQAWNVRKATA